MRKLLYTGGAHFDDGRTHPITRFHPNQADKDDGRPHALVDEDFGFRRIAEEPENFRWADAKRGDDARLDEAIEQLEEEKARKEAEAQGDAPAAAAPARQPALVQELAAANAKLDEQGQVLTAAAQQLAQQGEALTQAMEAIAGLNKKLAALEKAEKAEKASAKQAPAKDGTAADPKPANTDKPEA